MEAAPSCSDMKLLSINESFCVVVNGVGIPGQSAGEDCGKEAGIGIGSHVPPEM